MSQNLISRDFKGIWIPKEIWLLKTISIQKKALWSEIHSLYDEEKGGCYASDDYLCEFMGVKRSRLQEMLNNLTKVGMLEKVGFDGREVIRKAVIPPDDRTTDVRKTGQQGGKQMSGKPDSSRPENRTPIYSREKSLEKKEESKPKKNAVAASPPPAASDLLSFFDNRSRKTFLKSKPARVRLVMPSISRLF